MSQCALIFRGLCGLSTRLVEKRNNLYKELSNQGYIKRFTLSALSSIRQKHFFFAIYNDLLVKNSIWREVSHAHFCFSLLVALPGIPNTISILFWKWFCLYTTLWFVNFNFLLYLIKQNIICGVFHVSFHFDKSHKCNAISLS